MTADEYMEALVLVCPTGSMEFYEPFGRENGLIQFKLSDKHKPVQLVDRETARTWWEREQIYKQSKQTARAWWRR